MDLDNEYTLVYINGYTSHDEIIFSVLFNCTLSEAQPGFFCEGRKAGKIRNIAKIF